MGCPQKLRGFGINTVSSKRTGEYSVGNLKLHLDPPRDGRPENHTGEVAVVVGQQEGCLGQNLRRRPQQREIDAPEVDWGQRLAVHVLREVGAGEKRVWEHTGSRKCKTGGKWGNNSQNNEKVNLSAKKTVSKRLITVNSSKKERKTYKCEANCRKKIETFRSK